MEPCVDARAADPDRQVSLEHDSPFAGVAARLRELEVQVVLHEAVEGDLAAVAAGVCLDARLVVAGVFAPAGEVCRVERIAQGAEDGIGHEPVRVVRKEPPVFPAAGRAPGVALESLAQQLLLGAVDSFVVDLRQGVQLVAQAEVLPVGLDAGRGQAKVLRVQGECRDGVVGIGVLPGAGHRGVVDRQDLDDALPCGGGPVDEQPEVRKLPDAETLPRTERKDRDGRSGPAPLPPRKVRDGRRLDPVLMPDRRLRPDAVGPLFPADGGERRAVGDEELVLRAFGKGNRKAPFGESAVVHRHDLLPVAEAGGGDGENLFGPQRGEDDPERHVRGLGVDRRAVALSAPRRRLPGENPAGERRRVEGRVVGHLLPAVADAEHPECGDFGQHERVGTPFAADAGAVAFHGVAVDDGRAVGVSFDGAAPQTVFGVLQGDSPAAEQQDELFAPAGAVFDFEEEFHECAMYGSVLYIQK